MSAKARRLADLFRPPFDIMYKGAFEEVTQKKLDRSDHALARVADPLPIYIITLKARAAAREGKKWLLINVQDQSEFACQVLNRDLWSDSIVKEILKESFIFLQVRESCHGGVIFCINAFCPIFVSTHVTAARASVT